MRSEKGYKKFGEYLEGVDWDDFFLDCGRDVTAMVGKYQKLTNSWMDVCFPYKVVKKRSNEAPWITHGIRRRIRMRLAGGRAGAGGGRG